MRDVGEVHHRATAVHRRMLLEPRGDERGAEVAADEARRAGYENTHRADITRPRIGIRRERDDREAAIAAIPCEFGSR